MFTTRNRRIFAACALILVLVALLVVGAPSPGGSLAAFNATTNPQTNLIVSTNQTIGNTGTTHNQLGAAITTNNHLSNKLTAGMKWANGTATNTRSGAAVLGSNVTTFANTTLVAAISATKNLGAGNSGTVEQNHETSIHNTLAALANLTPVGHNLLL